MSTSTVVASVVVGAEAEGPAHGLLPSPSSGTTKLMYSSPRDSRRCLQHRYSPCAEVAPSIHTAHAPIKISAILGNSGSGTHARLITLSKTPHAATPASVTPMTSNWTLKQMWQHFADGMETVSRFYIYILGCVCVHAPAVSRSLFQVEFGDLYIRVSRWQPKPTHARTGIGVDFIIYVSNVSSIIIMRAPRL